MQESTIVNSNSGVHVATPSLKFLNWRKTALFFLKALKNAFQKWLFLDRQWLHRNV